MTTHVGTTALPLDDLSEFPGNARRGDVDTILDSLRANGQYKPLVVRRQPDGVHTILAGNHTFLALLRHEETGRDACADWEAAAGRSCQVCEADRSEPAALVHVIECDDAEAKRINLVDNKAADAGSYDEDALNAILASLDDLTGTGYSLSEAEMFAAAPAVSDTVPSLEDLEAEYGEPQETDLWPVLRVRVPPNVRDDFYELTQGCDDPSDDSVRFMALVQRVRATG